MIHFLGGPTDHKIWGPLFEHLWVVLSAVALACFIGLLLIIDPVVGACLLASHPHADEILMARLQDRLDHADEFEAKNRHARL